MGALQARHSGQISKINQAFWLDLKETRPAFLFPLAFQMRQCCSFVPEPPAMF